MAFSCSSMAFDNLFGQSSIPPSPLHRSQTSESANSQYLLLHRTALTHKQSLPHVSVMKAVQGHHDGHTISLQILNMLSPGSRYPFSGHPDSHAPRSAFATPPLYFDAHGSLQPEPPHPAVSPAIRHLISKNFSAPEIGAETGFRDTIVRHLQGSLRRPDRITAMCNVGKRAAVDQYAGVCSQCLHQDSASSHP